jgi:hypothetical protein
VTAAAVTVAEDTGMAAATVTRLGGTIGLSERAYWTGRAVGRPVGEAGGPAPAAPGVAAARNGHRLGHGVRQAHETPAARLAA